MNRAYLRHRAVENVFLVRERDRRRRRELWIILAAAVPLGLGLLTYSWIHQELVEAGYRIGELQRELHDTQQRERRLCLVAARLGHPERVESRAVAELGMAPPRLEQMIFLDSFSAQAPRAAATSFGPPNTEGNPSGSRP